MSARTTRAETLYSVIGGVRQLFHLLAREADQMHGDLEITASQRALLESLIQIGPATVPAVARAKGVTRQHIQTLANQLVAAGLVEAVENPAHQRSSLLRPTEMGEEAFREMRSREGERLRELARHLPKRDLEATVRTVEALRSLLERGEA